MPVRVANTFISYMEHARRSALESLRLAGHSPDTPEGLAAAIRSSEKDDELLAALELIPIPAARKLRPCSR